MASAPRIDELSSTQIHSDGKNSYNLRIIEYKNREGVTCRKFGISEFWWCDKSNRLYPSRKHHVFLPLSVWPKLVALGDQIEKYAHGFRGEGPAQSNDETIELGDAGEQSASGTRRRGRPPKRADERETSTPIKRSNAADAVAGDQDKMSRLTEGGTQTIANTQAEGAGPGDFVGYTPDDERTMQQQPQ